MSGVIIVVSRRQWSGNERMGRYTVYLDGRGVGTLHPIDRIEFDCVPGHHTIRIRQGYCFSEPFDVTIADGQRICLDADVWVEKGPLKRFWLLLLTPWKGLRLRLVTEPRGEAGDVRS